MIIIVATRRSLQEFPNGLNVVDRTTLKPRVLARDGTLLSVTFENAWNETDTLPLAQMPPLLVRAFIVSEDQSFASHHGVDWPARLAAVWANLQAHAAVRGASTITEQVVRMLHPRRRTLWSRWLEGFEAGRLEARCSKERILEFYLNQVPYADRRRGVVQAAHLYFDRSLDSLTPGELLSLAVLVRSPAGMDLRRNPARAQHAVDQLAGRLRAEGTLTAAEQWDIQQHSLVLMSPIDELRAGYFVRHVIDVSRRSGKPLPPTLTTTLDPHFQRRTQEILSNSLSSLKRRQVRDGGILVIDNINNEVLAWAVAHNATPGDSLDDVGRGFDTILTPRQPGSTMKPLLYAMALERGWTAATLIEDSELSESVGDGLHTFHNYSHVHYGPVRLREALGNSLNIPAVRTLRFVGREPFLARLRELGIQSLIQHPDYYGDGLALGNGEVSLYEMAQAYSALARHGRLLPLTVLQGDTARPETAVYDPTVARLIGDILADPEARTLEFGNGLQFPVETAIKTGTSTDYRDAWAIAYDYRHTVAAWLGNLDGSAMNGVTGSVGPAMVLRSVFSELNRNQDTRDLGSHAPLVAARICRDDGRRATAACESMHEWFIPGTEPASTAGDTGNAAVNAYLVLPTPGLQVARDPRIPSALEALPMQVSSVAGLTAVEWYVDGRLASRTSGPRFDWPLSPGSHEVYSRISTLQGSDGYTTAPVRFYVR
jgi:penicillin-binding protein 1C